MHPKGYDVFDHYYPGRKGLHSERSVYLEFASLWGKGSDDLVRFLSTYGPLATRAYLRPEITSRLKPEEPDPLADVWAAVTSFAAVLRLCDALEKGEREILRDLPGPILVPHQGRWTPLRQPNDLRRAAETVRTVLDKALQRATATIEWDESEKRWVSRWTFRSLLAALYLMLVFDLQGPGIQRQCPLDDYGCGDFFVAERLSARYCSPRCQNLAKVRRMRAKHRITQREAPHGTKRRKGPRNSGVAER